MSLVIVSAVRTPIGLLQGSLASLPATRLGSVALQAALERSGFPPNDLDEVLFGNVLSAGLGQAPARQVSLGAGVPPGVGATTINKVCGSGMKALMLADQAIRAGDGRAFAVGGMDSMSNAPYLLTRARAGYRLGHAELVDSMIRDGLWDVYEDYHMGVTAEFVAREYGITREAQDRYALRSNERARQAQQTAGFADEIIPIAVPRSRGEAAVVDCDEGPRETSMEALGALPPVFDKGGTVTAGNSSKISDGAAAMIVTSEAEADRRGFRPLARLLASGAHSLEPEWIMMAPVDAVRRALANAGLAIQDVDLFEINEPFAAATCAIIDRLDLDPARVNVHGGAVALGHPLGATGARVVVTLVHALRQRNGRFGVASLCLGGGEAVAVVLENLDR
jgi:acetyl-CoA C-acetyltransferase